MKFTSLIVSITFLSLNIFGLNQAHAKVLQEGWFQILSGQQHVGYVVQRYDFDEAKKQFKYTSFMKTNALGGDVTESVMATASDGFDPISYQYTTQVGKTAKFIDATFKAGSMTAKVTEGAETKTVQETIKKGTFLSYFLVYMILQNKSGLKSGASFEYNAIAEEDAKVYKGFADVKELEKINGHEAFKVLNRFKDIKSISHISPIGEVIQIKQPVGGVQIITSTKEDATKGFPSSDKSLKTLFGNVPQVSHLAKAKVDAAPQGKTVEFVEPSTMPKGTTIPPGKLPVKKAE